MTTVYDPGPGSEELRLAGIPVESLGIARSTEGPRSIARLARAMRLHRPHILHCHTPHAMLAARGARILHRVPVVIGSLHAWKMGDAAGNGRWMRQLLTRITQRLSDATTVSCREASKNAAFDKPIVVPTGIDLRRFRPDRDLRRQTRSDLHLGGAFVWLSASRFHPEKDHHTLVRAFARAAAACPDALLLLAGDGPARSEIAELVKSLQIEANVRFLGTRLDVPALMNAADGYVLASLSEALPAVLLEASATRLPMVTTDVGGTAGLVNHGVTGLAAPPANPEALGDTMIGLMSLSDDRRRELALNAHAHVSAHHDLELVADQWESLYRQLLITKGVCR